jgi:hypothetical protein
MNQSKIINWTVWIEKRPEFGGETGCGRIGTDREVLLWAVEQWQGRWQQILLLDEQDSDNTVCVRKDDPGSIEWAQEWFEIDLCVGEPVL